MTDEWRIREILEHILESHCDPEEACTKYPELLPAVRQRLKRVRQIEKQFEALLPSSTSAAANGGHAARATTDRLPRIEGYEVEGVLGRGGMGVVYTARHLKLKRVVALKMLLAGPHASPLEVARFVRESQAVAELQHPHVVQIYDVGDLDGRPFFTMEFVEGGTLAQNLAGAPQPARRAAEMTAKLARAVQSAHVKGIIHRDLKPANILLSVDGTPKIADFGLARHLDGDPELTMSGARLGTPCYMAPEQALGAHGSMGPSVDIYALGAILYEMLTGRPPFRAETAIETERQLLTTEVAPPSRLNANVPPDLETICLKCLRKDSARRYASAAELANDIERFLDGEPVWARPVGLLERAWCWGKRNKAVAAALSGVAVLLALIVVGSLWAAAHFRELESEHRLLAQQKGALADEKGRLVTEKEHEREKAVLAEKREVGLRRQSDAQRKVLRKTLYQTQMNLAGQALSVAGGLGRVSELLTRWGQELPDLRNWEWYYLKSLGHRCLLNRIGHMKGVLNVAWSPSGARLASAGADKTICIWDGFEEKAPLRLIGHTREVFSVAWSPDGRRLTSASWDHTVRVWDAATGTELFSFAGHTGEVYSVAWSPDGNTIASGGSDKTIHIWDANSGAVRSVLRGHESTVAGLDWSPDGRRLASGAHDMTIRIWDVAGGNTLQVLRGHINWVNQVAWSPDGAQLASASNDQTLRVWDPQSGQELRKFVGHTKAVTSIAWSPDGEQLASVSDDRTIKVWLKATATVVLSLRGHTAPLTTVDWIPNGRRLATAGWDAAVKIWDTTSGPETPVLSGHQHPVEALAWCQADSTLCASADAAGVVKIWKIDQRKVSSSRQCDEQLVNSLAWHPAGVRLAAACVDGRVRIWDLPLGQKPVILNAHTGVACSVAWSPDGRRVASGGFDGMIRIWDAVSAKLLREISKPQTLVYCVTWSPDGRRLASASDDRTVRIWNTETFEEVFCYRGHTSNVTTAAWSPDGTRMASAGFDQTVHLWDLATGQDITILRGHTSHVAQVIWSPDASRLASACRDGAVKIWDAETGNETLNLESHTNEANAVAWSPDGLILVSGAEDHQIRLYDATAGYVADRATQLLPLIDRRLTVDPSRSADWRLRAEICAKKRDWRQSAAAARKYLLLEPDPGWLMLDCVVAGPYSENLSLRCPPEDVDYFASQRVIAEEIASPADVIWKQVPYSAQGIVDFRPLTQHRDHVSAYALFPIYSPNDQDLAVLLGSDDQAVLWLNHEQRYQCLRSREAKPDEDAVPITLKTGWNTLLIRVANESGDHSLYLRLSNSVTDLRRARDGAE